MPQNEYEVVYGQTLQDSVLKGNTVIMVNGNRIDKTNADKIPVGDFAVTKEISQNMAKSMIDGASQDKKGTKYLHVELCNVASEVAYYYDNKVAYEQGKIDEQGLHVVQKNICYALNKSPISDKIGIDVIPSILKQIDKGAAEKVMNIPPEKRKGIHPPDEGKMFKKEFVNAFNSTYTRVVSRLDSQKLANRDNKAERYAEGAYKSKVEADKKIMETGYKVGYTEGVAKSAAIVARNDKELAKKILTDTKVTAEDIKKYASRETKQEAEKHLLKPEQQTQTITQGKKW